MAAFTSSEESAAERKNRFVLAGFQIGAVPIVSSLARICNVMSSVAGAFAVYAVTLTVWLLQPPWPQPEAVVVLPVSTGVDVLLPARATTSTTEPFGDPLTVMPTVADALEDVALNHHAHW